MIGMFRSLGTTIMMVFKRPVTVEYPKEHLPLSSRYLGFPALIWNDKVDEPACTGCQVCMRYCPTDCIDVTMQDNPKFPAGESKHRKIVDDFQIRMERCILCGICVEVCTAFEAIVMTDYHEEADISRGNLIASKEDLFRMGRDFQQRNGIVNEMSVPEAKTLPEDSGDLKVTTPNDLVSGEEEST